MVRLPGFDSLAFRGTLTLDPFHDEDILGRRTTRPDYFSGEKETTSQQVGAKPRHSRLSGKQKTTLTLTIFCLGRKQVLSTAVEPELVLVRID